MDRRLEFRDKAHTTRNKSPFLPSHPVAPVPPASTPAEIQFFSKTNSTNVYVYIEQEEKLVKGVRKDIPIDQRKSFMVDGKRYTVTAFTLNQHKNFDLDLTDDAGRAYMVTTTRDFMVTNFEGTLVDNWFTHSAIKPKS